MQHRPRSETNRRFAYQLWDYFDEWRSLRSRFQSVSPEFSRALIVLLLRPFEEELVCYRRNVKALSAYPTPHGAKSAFAAFA